MTLCMRPSTLTKNVKEATLLSQAATGYFIVQCTFCQASALSLVGARVSSRTKVSVKGHIALETISIINQNQLALKNYYSTSSRTYHMRKLIAYASHDKTTCFMQKNK